MLYHLMYRYNISHIQNSVRHAESFVNISSLTISILVNVEDPETMPKVIVKIFCKRFVATN